MSNPCWFCTSKDTHENCVGCYNKRNFHPRQTAASAWRTHEPPLEQAPETILAQIRMTGGYEDFVLIDTVGVEIFGKQEWHLYEHNTDRRFYGKIIAWTLINPYEGVE